MGAICSVCASKDGTTALEQGQIKTLKSSPLRGLNRTASWWWINVYVVLLCDRLSSQNGFTMLL